LSTVIEGDVELHDAIQATNVDNLSVMTCGRSTPNPSELLTSPRFKELLDVLRDQFDFIILDTPPMLAVTDPSVVAPRADGVVLVLRITKQSRAAAMRATEMLATMGANVLGVVVNGFGQKRGYGYGYDYGGYGYGGSYSYADRSDAGRYFSDQDSEAADAAGQEERASNSEWSFWDVVLPSLLKKSVADPETREGEAPAEPLFDGLLARREPRPPKTSTDLLRSDVLPGWTRALTSR
jgi:Mrp family chromosome partitioning ATPase